MPSALKSGRPVRFRPSRPGSAKPPECAGIYYIRDADGNNIYTGQSVNLRKRVYQHKRNGKIPEGGYVDCYKAKDGITYDELDSTERTKINKYNPPLNKRGGGGGRKSPKLKKSSASETVTVIPVSQNQPDKQKRNFLYRLLGYEKVDRSGDVHFKKEPKAVFFMLIELIVKTLLAAVALSAIFGIYLYFTKGSSFSRDVLKKMIAVPIICLVLFRYIRRNTVFSIIAVLSAIAGIFLYYLSSYPLPFDIHF